MENRNRPNSGGFSSQTIVLILILVAIIVFGIVAIKDKNGTNKQEVTATITTEAPQSNSQNSLSTYNPINVNVPIYYISDDGLIFNQEWKIFSPGTYTVYRNTSKSGSEWIPISDSYCQVTVYNDGTTNPSEVYFWFTKTSPQSVVNGDNVATIIDKLYLRTGPGKPPSGSGIPNNSYETYRCPGDTINLVARSYNKSQSMWWFQLEGSIYEVDLRRTIDVSGLWTADKYLDDSSYDFYSIPEVAGY